MNALTDLFFNPKVTLTRHDLIGCERLLAQDIATFLHFKSHSLYFPQTLSPEMAPDGDLDKGQAVYLPAERKLLLPLYLDPHALLGVFMARGVALRAPASMCRLLPRMARLCLERLLLHKMGVTDAMTGLANGHHFLRRVSEDVGRIQGCLRPETSDPEETSPGFRASLGVVHLRLDGLRRINQEFGFLFGDRVVEDMAARVARLAPPQAFVGRKDDACIIHLPEGTPTQCAALAATLRQDMAEATYSHDLSGSRVRCAVSAGYATYPRDMEGPDFERPIEEQARLVILKAKHASDAARGMAAAGKAAPDALGFHQIVREGGRVVDILPAGRLTVSLGKTTGAREGQRFLVWAGAAAQAAQGPDGRPNGVAPGYKGEIILLDVAPDKAVAEVLHQADTAWPLATGDGLTLLEADNAADPAAGSGAAPRVDPVTGLLRYSDFLAAWTREREACGRFVMTLVRLAPAQTGDAARFHSGAERLLGEAAGYARAFFAEHGLAALGGRHSLTSMAFFHADAQPRATLDIYRELCARLERKCGCTAAAGLASHPFLTFHKADAPENCAKALEYALWLPAPRAGMFCSLAMTISADKAFCQGDLFGAMDEYKLALLDDEHNALARNSLGVCLARLGKAAEARRHFEAVIARDRKDVMALYNLGYVLQKLGEADGARKAYQRCLRHCADHGYALIRLGQLAEADGRLAQARKYYQRAADTRDGQGVTRRYLARLALRQQKPEEARELLHQALVHDPKDAACLHLMAKLYLDGGEDPEIAEALARQSVALQPGQKRFWLELARALEAGGKADESRAALDKARDL
ncbi:MAG: tetratricopeptide repeat protein [Desulfovibrionaceae bacterium]